MRAWAASSTERLAPESLGPPAAAAGPSLPIVARVGPDFKKPETHLDFCGNAPHVKCQLVQTKHTRKAALGGQGGARACVRHLCCGLRQQSTRPYAPHPRGWYCSVPFGHLLSFLREEGRSGRQHTRPRCPPCHRHAVGLASALQARGLRRASPLLPAPPGAVLPQRQPDGRAAGGRRRPGPLGHGPQGPGAGPEKRRLPAPVQSVAGPAARHPQQGEGAGPAGAQPRAYSLWLWGL